MNPVVAKIVLSLLAAVPVAKGDDFEQSIRPLLKQHCNGCHSTALQKGDLDLERFASIAQVKKHPSVWESAFDQLANSEMPPKDRPPLEQEEKKRLTQWIRKTLDEIALANANDPGPVVLRRLSNMEYTYTIRDLTGVATLDPANEFPVDGAAGEGFSNVGSALVMSPSLLTKYLDAAKDIAGHAVLLPDGLRFSAFASDRDWTEETLQQIRGIYALHCEPPTAPGEPIEVKGELSDRGRLQVDRYLTALLNDRDALNAGKTSIASVASEQGLNAKYTAMLWTALHDKAPSLILDGIRRQFRSLSPAQAPVLIQTISDWQQSLWRFSKVGHIGKRNGPKAWQEPATPLTAKHEMRVPLTPAADGRDIVLYLAVSDAGDGAVHDVAVWENGRLTKKGRPDVLLRDILPEVAQSAQRVKAPSVIEVRLPASSTDGGDFVIEGRLHRDAGADASVQMQVLDVKPVQGQGLITSKAIGEQLRGKWSDNNQRTTHAVPVIVNKGSAARRRFEAAFDDFRRLFPVALCYMKIVPVDEIVTLTLFYREDDQLKRLMLNESQSAALDRFWSELIFVSEAPLRQVDVFDQLYQFATQDANPSAFEPMRETIARGAEEFAKQQALAEPRHVDATLDFAERAWRRPLADTERTAMQELYRQLRAQSLPHASAIRMLLARVLVAPAFLYRGERAAPGVAATPVDDWELATRLSYFMWSSTPDDQLRRIAQSGRLRQPETLLAETRRMLKDPKVRRLATEFGCQWLHVRDLETLDEKSERHFPTFVSLRGAMQEEAVRFFIDFFRDDRSVLSLLDADHSFVNGPLARHYGVETKADEWQRIDGLRAKGRGGILAFASTLSKQSGASRTSPILRGNWVSEALLGDKLPRPPKDVPVLPDEAPAGLTERQLIERHSSDAKCAGCHLRIDPFGFALEEFDAIGRRRNQDSSGQTVDARVRLPDGAAFAGLDGLRAYLLSVRRDDFVRQFCRKLLGYALGRSVQLSDQPLLDAMMDRLQANDYRVQEAIECIVTSKQFLEIRGQAYVAEEQP